MAIWQSRIAKKLLVIWLCCITKRLLAILRQPIAKHMLAILATSYCLNRNDRVISFGWTWGSKQCFLTCFSTFSIFVKLLLTNFLALVHCTCAPMFLEQNVWVSQSKTLVGTW